KCFRNWPKDGEPLDVKVVAEKEAEGLKLQVLEFTSEENLRFPVYVVRGAKNPKPSLLVVTPVDTAAWQKWVAEMVPAFGDLLPSRMAAYDGRSPLESTAKMLDKNPWAFAYIPPRGEGPNQWDPDPRKDTHIRRRFLLLGRTADDGQVWGTRRALQALRTRDEYKDGEPWVPGGG